MIIKEYNRTAAVEYARLWWNKRNPAYYNFDKIGGDCTNFASQCLLAGCQKMNYTTDHGWYYNNSNDRAPAWTDVDHFYYFLTNNFNTPIGNGLGPFAEDVSIQNIDIGDFIQLSNDGIDYHHNAIVVDMRNNFPLLSAHTFDTFLRPLNTYFYNYVRFIHILGVRK